VGRKNEGLSKAQRKRQKPRKGARSSGKKEQGQKVVLEGWHLEKGSIPRGK
jgi:hypothetical protein